MMRFGVRAALSGRERPSVARVAALAVLFAAADVCAADLALSGGADVAEALRAASGGDTITLGAGVYSVHGIVVDKGVAIVAKAGSDVTIDLQSQTNGIRLADPGARLEGCRVVNCSASAVVVEAGAQLVDCVFTGRNEIVGTGAEIVSLRDGTIRGCTFRDFTSAYAFGNHIIRVSGGTLADSAVEGAGSQFDWMVCVDGASAVVTNLVIRNSPGKGNGNPDATSNGVLYLANGLVTHSVVTNSGSVGAAKNGTVMIAGGTLRDSIVMDCLDPNHLGVNMTGGTVVGTVFSNVGFAMDGGLARDVVVRNRFGQSKGTLVAISGGTCDGLVMTNCRTTVWNNQHGIELSDDARLVNFTIDNCAGYDRMLSVGGLAMASNGSIRASNGVLGTNQGNTKECLVHMQGGLVSHVSVTDCGDTRADRKWGSRDGTVRVAGGTMRNCLVAGNRSTDCAGVNLSSGCLESCTVVVNEGDVLHQTGFGVYGSCLNMTGGAATNCVFYTKETASADRRYCLVKGGEIGNCWLSVKGGDATPVGADVLVGADPGFRTAGGWEYVPTAVSPLHDKGVNRPWMSGASDFAGRSRICGRHVDLGAFEGDPRGVVIFGW